MTGKAAVEAMTDGVVVVLFAAGPAEGWCTLNHCPLGTAEWFPSREAAGVYLASLPAGFQPHILTVHRRA